MYQHAATSQPSRTIVLSVLDFQKRYTPSQFEHLLWYFVTHPQASALNTEGPRRVSCWVSAAAASFVPQPVVSSRRVKSPVILHDVVLKNAAVGLPISLSLEKCQTDHYFAICANCNLVRVNSMFLMPEMPEPIRYGINVMDVRAVWNTFTEGIISDFVIPPRPLVMKSTPTASSVQTVEDWKLNILRYILVQSWAFETKV